VRVGRFYTVVKADKIINEAKLKKLVLVVRVPFSDRDAITDTAIIKSQTYTIIDSFMTLAFRLSGTITSRCFLDRSLRLAITLPKYPFNFQLKISNLLLTLKESAGKS
jgi:hypothetical protein